MYNHTPISVSFAADTRTSPAPIDPSWILVGEPAARAATLSQSKDKDAVTVLWECTEGIFRWRFDSDETVYIIDGSVTVHFDGERTKLKAGDSCYFPAGTIATWSVHGFVRKIAFIRVPPPKPVSFALRAARYLKRKLAPSPAAGGLGELKPAVE